MVTLFHVYQCSKFQRYIEHLVIEMPAFKEVKQAYLDAARALGFVVPADARELALTNPEGVPLVQETVLDYIDTDEIIVGDDMLSTMLPHLDDMLLALLPGAEAVVMVPYLNMPSNSVCLGSNLPNLQVPM